MGKQAVVFTTKNLEDRSVRQNLVRIPEVSMRLTEAQTLIEAAGRDDCDLFSFLISDDADFQANAKLKSLCAAIVQVGLYDRVKKSGVAGDIFIGAKEQDSALKVVTGRTSFARMVVESPAIQIPVQTTLMLIPAPLLPHSVQFQVVSNDGSEIAVGHSDAKQILRALVSQNDVTQVLNIGPASPIDQSEQVGIGASFEDAITRDPLLSWFWRDTAALAG